MHRMSLAFLFVSTRRSSSPKLARCAHDLLSRRCLSLQLKLLLFSCGRACWPSPSKSWPRWLLSGERSRCASEVSSQQCSWIAIFALVVQKRAAGSASALRVPQDRKTEDDVLSSLRATCGNECLDLWNMAATGNSSEHGPLYGTLVSLATMAQRKVRASIAFGPCAARRACLLCCLQIQAEAPEAHPSFAKHQEHLASKLSAAAAHVAGTSDDTGEFSIELFVCHERCVCGCM